MKESKLVHKNGNPIFLIDGQETPPLAYITYFEENNDYRLFAEKGFRLFTVSVSLSDQPINADSGFKPYAGGVFDKKGHPDFSAADASIKTIVGACPDAYIFPRVYICMPQWWIDENPTETIPVAHGKRREALYSQKFREDAAEMLVELIEHFRTFEYADHIIGYHISGGGTQEWFHVDRNGSYHENALPYFSQYLNRKIEKLPDLDGMYHSRVIEDPLLSKYIRFASDCVAQTVEYFCKVAKEALENKQLVGVFYGYALEVPWPLWGTHSLTKLLDCPYIDFFSSPNSYVNGRSLGIDWPDMMPADSIKLHGKMSFIECDVRTYLTVSPREARKGCDPYNSYIGDLWDGPPTEALSVYAVRKSLARQLTHKHGLWWFDMFGHWYSTPALMDEMKLSQQLYHQNRNDMPEYPVEVALFVDENAYSKIGEAHPQYNLIRSMREHWGKMGAPLSVFLTCDFDKIDWAKSAYKAVFFMIPEGEEFVSKTKKVLDSHQIASLYITEVTNADELRRFLKDSGVFILCESNDVLYFGNGFAALHSATAGEKTVFLPEVLVCTDVVSNATQKTSTLSFYCKQFETKIFSLAKE